MKSALAIQCLPLSAQSKEIAYGLVDRAIQAIDQSGLAYTVGPFETVIEGSIEQLFDVARKAHEAILDDGGRNGSGVATYMKLFSGEDLGSSEEKTGKYRAAGH